MSIYLIYENVYDEDELRESICSVYPYKNFENAIERIATETGKDITQVQLCLHASGYVSSGAFLYRLEETELM